MDLDLQVQFPFIHVRTLRIPRWGGKVLKAARKAGGQLVRTIEYLGTAAAPPQQHLAKGSGGSASFSLINRASATRAGCANASIITRWSHRFVAPPATV